MKKKKSKKSIWIIIFVAQAILFFAFLLVLVGYKTYPLCNEWELMGGCEQLYVPFVENYSLWESIQLFGQLIVIFILSNVFLYQGWKKFRSVPRSNWSLHNKVLILILEVFILVTYFCSLLVAYTYSGFSCLLDNCVDISLFGYLAFWFGFFFLVPVLIPFFLAASVVSLIVVSLYHKFKTKK